MKDSDWLETVTVLEIANQHIYATVFFRNGPLPAPFFFSVFVFSIQLTVNVQYKFLMMSVFEPRTSGLEVTVPTTEPQPLPSKIVHDIGC